MKKLAVHLHLYYLEQLPEILEYLQSLKEQDYDLFVTMIKHVEEAEKAIKYFNPKAEIFILPNQGYDVGPFIEFLHKIDLEKYSYILKIHTKGNVSQNHTWLNKHRLDNKLWGKILFDSLLKNKERVQNNLDILDHSPHIGILSSQYCITDEKRTYDKLLPRINDALNELNLKGMDSLSFVAGTMFYVRAELLKPLLKYTIQDFSVTDAKVKEGTFAHVMERLLGAIVLAQGSLIHGIKHDNYRKQFLIASLKHFLFQKKKTEHRLLVKICKIPIYSKKLGEAE